MKFVNSRSLLAVIGLISAAGVYAQPASKVYVVPRAPIQDGSNASRAPFPAHRLNDDVKAPNGQALDQDLPPNTPATEPLPPPPPTVAILQRTSPSINEPTLAMTGRPTTGVTATLAPQQVAAAINGQDFSTREKLIDDIEVRVRSSEGVVRGFRDTELEMSPEARASFDAKAKDLEVKLNALRASSRAARAASDSEWAAARTQLAADYQAYVTTAASIDAAAGLPPAQN